MRRKWKLVLAAIGLLALMLIIYQRWPSRARFAVPYQQAVEHVKSLYPILDFKTVSTSHKSFHGDTRSIRRTYPAYDYIDPLWDLDVSHQELVPGERFQIEIVNRSKFDKRETTITIEADGDGSRITVESWEVDLLVLRIPWRARRYERDRFRELRIIERLKKDANR